MTGVGVSISDGGERLIEPRPRAVDPGQSMINVNLVRRHANFDQGGTLGGQILLIGGAASVTDDCFAHRRCTLKVPSVIFLSYQLNETQFPQLFQARGAVLAVR